MKLKKIWDFGLTVFVVIFIYLLLKYYFPAIMEEIRIIFDKFAQSIKNFIQTL